MTSQPEVSITIMTGGHRGLSIEGETSEPGPTPIPLDLLPGFGADTADAEVPPTPLDLDALAAEAAGPRRAPAKKATAKKSPAKKAPAKRSRR